MQISLAGMATILIRGAPYVKKGQLGASTREQKSIMNSDTLLVYTLDTY